MLTLDHTAILRRVDQLVRPGTIGEYRLPEGITRQIQVPDSCVLVVEGLRFKLLSQTQLQARHTCIAAGCASCNAIGNNTVTVSLPARTELCNRDDELITMGVAVKLELMQGSRLKIPIATPLFIEGTDVELNVVSDNVYALVI